MEIITNYVVTFTVSVSMVIFTILLLLCKKSSETKEKKIEKTKYQYLLEFPSNYEFSKSFINEGFITMNPLYRKLNEYCKEHNVYRNGVVISLSGGVDSMVTFALLLHLQSLNYFPIYTATIDYGLRTESKDESEFIEMYTKQFNIKSYIVDINSMTGLSRKKEDSSNSRTEFEEETRNIRFDTYKKIMTENKMNSESGVFVAHHMDDIVENIFTNSMRGANLLDLEVMKSVNHINGVKLFRPFLEFKKQTIYDFAHEYKIPYFKDTTPKWSKRGKMRNEIFPLLDNVFGTMWRDKLKQLGDQSNQWNDMITNYVINPWFDEIKFERNHFMIPIKKNTKIIYTNLIMKTLHSVGQNMLKRTSIDKIYELSQHPNYPKLVTLDGNRTATLKNNHIVIVYK
jgi:tRNA(Ile)-lysidine synthetase-like protein